MSAAAPELAAWAQAFFWMEHERSRAPAAALNVSSTPSTLKGLSPPTLVTWRMRNQHVQKERHGLIIGFSGQRNIRN